MDTKIARFPVTTKVLETPALIERLDENTTGDVLGQLLETTQRVLRHFIDNAWAREVADAHKSGDHLLSLEEVAERLDCLPQTISRGWRAGRYPFMLKDGAHLVGSEDGLRRWLKARAHSPRHNQ